MGIETILYPGRIYSGRLGTKKSNFPWFGSGGTCRRIIAQNYPVPLARSSRNRAPIEDNSPALYHAKLVYDAGVEIGVEVGE